MKQIHPYINHLASQQQVQAVPSVSSLMTKVATLPVVQRISDMLILNLTKTVLPSLVKGTNSCFLQAADKMAIRLCAWLLNGRVVGRSVGVVFDAPLPAADAGEAEEETEVEELSLSPIDVAFLPEELSLESLIFFLCFFLSLELLA